jgi:hypothetical protein
MFRTAMTAGGALLALALLASTAEAQNARELPGAQHRQHAQKPSDPRQTQHQTEGRAGPGQSHQRGKTIKPNFSLSDDDGNLLYDDGNPDGRGCVVGKQAHWDKTTGTFYNTPQVKCNFDN